MTNSSTLRTQTVMTATPERSREIQCPDSDTRKSTNPIWAGVMSLFPGDKSVASACCCLVVLALIMTSTSTSNPSSIFKDGKLKPGIYKIQSLYNNAYLDIHEHAARELHLRPAQDLGEGKGLVRRHPFHVVCV